MYAAEQHSEAEVHYKPKKAVSVVGTSLVKRKPVKNSFTYRDITLIIGMIVAVIVAITLFFASGETTASGTVMDEFIPKTFAMPQATLVKKVLIDTLLP
jgi:hypothetical protein